MTLPDSDFSDLFQRLAQQASRRQLGRLAAGSLGAVTAWSHVANTSAKKKRKKKKKKGGKKGGKKHGQTTTLAPTTQSPTTRPPSDRFAFDRELGSLVEDHPELLNSPGPLATDATGNLFVLEWGRNRIAKYGPNGDYQGNYGSRGNGNGQFDDPVALAIDSSGRMYVADVIPSDFGSPHRIQVLKPNGDYLDRLGSMNGDHLEEVNSIAVASNGHVFVSGGTSDGPRGIYEWDATFTYVGRRITLALQEIITAIAVDSGNRLYAGFVRFADYPYTNSLKVYALSDFTEITAFGSTGAGDGQFESFYGVAADASGNVYVSDSDNARVQRLTWNGGFTALAYAGEVAIPGSWEDEFGGPGSVTVGNGSVYVSDYANSCVRRFSQALVEQSRIGEPGVGQFLSPDVATTDADGNVYVLDNNFVHKLTGQGGAVKKWGGYGSGPTQLRFPGSIALSPANELYIADGYNARIQVYSTSGDLQRSLASAQLTHPLAVAFAADGSYLVANDASDEVRVFTAADAYDGSWRAPDTFAGDIAVASNGRVYVTDASNDVVRMYTSAGTPQGSFAIPWPSGVAVDASGRVVVASWPDDESHVFVRDRNGAPIFTVGGPGQFSSPVDVHVTPTGNLLVTDFDNGLLRFTPGSSRAAENKQASGKKHRDTRRNQRGKHRSRRKRGKGAPGRLSSARSSSRRG
ncbi:MAG: NHL repeat-containing protein [Chloroflexota bacterium]|nr:NHL repeat-containing protein [Chloroflexota bacterium]